MASANNPALLAQSASTTPGPETISTAQLEAAYATADPSYKRIAEVPKGVSWGSSASRTYQCPYDPELPVLRANVSKIFELAGVDKPKLKYAWVTTSLWESKALADMPVKGEIPRSNLAGHHQRVLAAHAAIQEASLVLVVNPYLADRPQYYDGIFLPGRIGAIVSTVDLQGPGGAACQTHIEVESPNRRADTWSPQDQAKAEQELLTLFSKQLVETPYWKSQKGELGPLSAKWEASALAQSAPATAPKASLEASERRLADLPPVAFAPSLDLAQATPDQIAKRVDLAASYVKSKPSRSFSLLAEMANSACQPCISALHAALLDPRFEPLVTDLRFLELALIKTGRRDGTKKTGPWVTAGDNSKTLRFYQQGRATGPVMDFGEGGGGEAFLNKLQTFEKGKLHGAFKEVDSWHTSVGVYKKGQKDGLWVWTRPEGGKWKEITYRSGVRHGHYATYDEEGSLLFESEFDNGSGPWQSYSIADGSLLEKGRLEQGKKVGTWEIQTSDLDVQYEIGTYVNDHREGEWIINGSDGKEIARGPYRNDKPHGTWKIRDGKDEVIQVLELANGKLVKVDGKAATSRDRSNFNHEMYQFPRRLN